MARLWIRLDSPDFEQHAEWLVCDESNVLETGSSQVSSLTEEIERLTDSYGRLDTTLLIPDQEVLLVTVDIPGRSASRIRQAAPYAVEPYLTDEIDDVHVAYGEVKRGLPTQCMSVNRSLLRSYLTCIDEANIPVQAITTVGALSQPNGVDLIENSDSISIRTSQELAVVSNGAATQALTLVLQSTQPIESVSCIGSEAFHEKMEQLTQQAELTEETQTNRMSLEDWLVTAGQSEQSLNLLQGEFNRTEVSVSPSRIGNRSAVGVTIMMCAISLVFWVQGLWAAFESDELREDALDVYEEIYGTRSIAGSPVFRMQEQLGAVGDSRSDWLYLMEQVAEPRSAVEMTNLDFNSAQRRLTMTFTANSFAVFESFRNALEQSQLKLDVDLAEQQNNLVWARVTVSMP